VYSRESQNGSILLCECRGGCLRASSGVFDQMMIVGAFSPSSQALGRVI